MAKGQHHRELEWLPVELLTCDDKPREGETEKTTEALRASIRRSGILHPIIIADTKSCKVVAGRRRLRAAIAEGHERVPVLVARDLDTKAKRLQVELDENVERLPLSQAEQLRLIERLRPAVEAAARQRQQATQLAGKTKGGKAKQKGSPPVGGTKRGAPKGRQGRANEQLGKAVGLSGESVRKAEVVKKAARDQPSLYSDLAARMLKGDLTIHAAYTQLRQRQAVQPPPTQTPRSPAGTPSPDVGDTGEGRGPTRAQAGEGSGAVPPPPPEQPEWVATQFRGLLTKIKELHDALAHLLAEGELTEEQLTAIDQAMGPFDDAMEHAFDGRSLDPP